MKKTLGTYISQYFQMPHLYRDDLEAIENVILHELKPGKYSVACGGLEYDRIDEIPDDLRTTNVLVIYTSHPSVRLKFSRSWTELYSGEEVPGMDSAMRKIAQLVSHGERRWLWKSCQSSAWLAPLIGFGSFALVTAWIGLGLLGMRSIYLVTLLMILMSIWWAVGYRYKLHCFSRVDLQTNRPKTPWVHRHREALLLFLAGLALGGVSVFLLALFFQLL